MARRALTIGRLAAAAGVNVETIRYYQRRGLLDEPNKPFQGYRHYPDDTVKRVRFIKRAQALGFTLEEIAGLLRLDGGDCCAAAASWGYIDLRSSSCFTDAARIDNHLPDLRAPVG